MAELTVKKSPNFLSFPYPKCFGGRVNKCQQPRELFGRKEQNDMYEQGVLGIDSNGRAKIYKSSDGAWKSLPSYLQSGPMLVYGGAVQSLEDRTWNKVCTSSALRTLSRNAAPLHLALEAGAAAPVPSRSGLSHTGSVLALLSVIIFLSGRQAIAVQPRESFKRGCAASLSLSEKQTVFPRGVLQDTSDVHRGRWLIICALFLGRQPAHCGVHQV
jgi:hypothetical protein